MRRIHMLVLCLPLLLLAGEDKDKEWDVNEPPFKAPFKEAAIDTTEGTWLNLDVSPDGGEIVFDLLGDIYIMPITGGRAKELTAGLSWDIQPKFSPDGKRIAFTSDRAGGDNLWIMDRNGGNPTQVTKESFRLLNGPTWTPDGEFIAARKHFTSTRSLGAGEIWMYHHTGGSGIQLTKRPNDQKDVNEPVFSPDGRYLYFCQDTTPGDVFEYSKDPTPGIYSIRRLDLETRELETYISGPGGAIRPTPSPDGKYLAFIRRQDYGSRLYLHEIASGRNTMVYDALDRDMQEAWAIHNVYPAMAWTPDGKHLVFWAKGKINKLDIASGKAEEIPFRVKSTRRIYDPPRHPVEVAADNFNTKMLRWVNVSPKGDKVVFQALGHLYIRNLPEGKPRRLTSQNDHFEFYPSFSRDGSQIAYVSWHDEKLGAVRVVSADGGEGKVITDSPGHFLSPSFSPDGKTVVFRKTGGGYMRTPLYSRDTGIYIVSADGGEMKRIVTRASDPHFGADNDRVFVTRYERGGRVLTSMDLRGADARDIASGEMVNEMRVSPDGQWLAFVDGFKAYALRLPTMMEPLSLGPKVGGIPMKQLSAEAGEYLHWSGDGKTVYWSLGDKLFSRNLKDSFTFMPNAPEKALDPPKLAEGIDLGFEAPFAKPEGMIALTGARIITMKGDQIIENGTVVVKGNVIQNVGPADKVAVPSDAEVVDMSGHTIVPGFIDAHAHGPQGAEEINPQQNWLHFNQLSFGVTTIHDPSNDTSTIFAASELSKAGLITAPRIFSTGTILYGARGPGYLAEVNNYEDAQFHITRMKAAGAVSVKSYNQPRRNQRQQILEAAREQGVMVVPEGGSLFEMDMNLIADGHTGIEHNIPVETAYDDVIQFWGASKSGYTPTLVVCFGGMAGEMYWYQHTDVWKHPKMRAFTPPNRYEPNSRRRTKAPEKEYNHIRVAETCKKLLDAGVLVNTGAHGQREGLALHWEMWMFAQGGMTPMEVLRCATINPATHLGMDKFIGSIEKGKLADLAILAKNPLEDIHHSETVAYTMINGRLFDANSMNEVGTGDAKRQPMFWEQAGGESITVPGKTIPGSTCRH